ncbi:hydantoinase/carbamoylase family amidase [Candidatus Poriferisodalis sp.]|uniref:Zn-dependent hydrolase n=1 Tax=Candidatus Poriferisodalis sp. TaxID=3101277 RepID=UPI003B027278
MSRHTYDVDGERLWRTLGELAEIGATPSGGVARVALTDDDHAGRDRFVAWVLELGCSTHVDQMGNLFARREGTDPDRLPVVIGSHLDSQPTGGRYDGAYGVMVGLEILRVLADHDVSTAAPIEVVSWTNEEGARFPPAMIGSGVYAGAFSLEEGLAAPGVDGTTLGAELARIGYAGNEPCGQPDGAGRRPIGYYIEPHIEQGPILEAAGVTLGAVTGVQGIRWYDVTIEGQSAHAGSTPMEHRSDAMVAAARLVCEADEIAARRAPEGRATVGTLTVGTGSRNTVAGSVTLTVDLRHPDATELEAMHDELLALAEGPAFGQQHSAASSDANQHSAASSDANQHSAASSDANQHSAASSDANQHSAASSDANQHSAASSDANQHSAASSDANQHSAASSDANQHSAASSDANQHSAASSDANQHSAASSDANQHSAASSGVDQPSRSVPRPQVSPIWYSPPIVFDPTVVEAVRAGAAAAGFEPMDITSGAGHDACYVSQVAPTGMLFIPCADGLSHNEAESILPEHATAGAQATLNAVLALAG